MGNAELVTTPDACVAFVERVGLCAWSRAPHFPTLLASLGDATPWAGDTGALMNHTWFWKDDLHIARRLFYGQILKGGKPAFVSLGLFPCLIAAQGDIDARDLHEKGRLAHNALTVYEHVERHGPTATNRLPWPPGSRHLYLAQLQQRFLLTKHALTGRTRGTYGYVWGLCHEFFPDAFAQAARLPPEAARTGLVRDLNERGTNLTPAQTALLLDWPRDA